MSPVVMPFAYSEITLPASPSRRRWCLGTVTGSNVPVAVPRDPQLDVADLGRHRLRVARRCDELPAPAARRVVGFVAEMLRHLDLEPGLQAPGAPVAVNRPPSPVSSTPSDAGPSDELLGPLPHRRRHPARPPPAAPAQSRSLVDRRSSWA